MPRLTLYTKEDERDLWADARREAELRGQSLASFVAQAVGAWVSMSARKRLVLSVEVIE